METGAVAKTERGKQHGSIVRAMQIGELDGRKWDAPKEVRSATNPMSLLFLLSCLFLSHECAPSKLNANGPSWHRGERVLNDPKVG